MMQPQSRGVSKADRHPLFQCVLLFTNFFLIITALYHLKPASRSIFMSEVGSEYMPYVWIATAVALGAMVSWYYRMIARYTRWRVVTSTVLIIILLLLGFRLLLQQPSAGSAFVFLMFVDMLSVVLVEQFWSLTNTLYSEEDGKRWYGFIAAGGLVGGVAGGVIASQLIRHTGLETIDLLPVAALILLGLIGLLALLRRNGLYHEHPESAAHDVEEGSWRAILAHPYLKLITAIVLLAQVIEPLVEYQFMTAIEAEIEGREARTAYMGEFFSLLGVVAISVNLLIVPLVHRWLGVIAGLAAQPLAVIVSSLFYMSAPGLAAGAVLKIADRGLSYSINRASRELLYITVDPLLIFQAKAWIDMFGYRLFRVLGSVMILLLTQWLPFSISVSSLGWLVLLVCMLWGFTLLQLRREFAWRSTVRVLS